MHVLTYASAACPALTQRRVRWPMLSVIVLAHLGALALLVHAVRHPPPHAVTAPLFVHFVTPSIPTPTPPTPPLAAPRVSVPDPVPIAPPLLEVASPTTPMIAPASSTAQPSVAPSTPSTPSAAAAPTALTPTPPPPIRPPDYSAAYLDNPAPTYPAVSRRLGETGVVHLRVQVSAEGHATEVLVHRSSGYPRLDQAALAAVRAWRFVPAQQAGQAIAAWVIVPLNFRLDR